MRSDQLWHQGAWVLLAAGAVQAADLAPPMRDPMSPPAIAQAPSRPADTATAPTEIALHHLMLIDGRRYVIDAGRRLGVGDMLGNARIERIDDGAVWLREGGVLRQVSLFGGIAKRVQAVDEAASSPGRPARRDTSPPANSTLPTGKRS